MFVYMFNVINIDGIMGNCYEPHYFFYKMHTIMKNGHIKEYNNRII